MRLRIYSSNNHKTHIVIRTHWLSHSPDVWLYSAGGLSSQTFLAISAKHFFLDATWEPYPSNSHVSRSSLRRSSCGRRGRVKVTQIALWAQQQSCRSADHWVNNKKIPLYVLYEKNIPRHLVRPQLPRRWVIDTPARHSEEIIQRTHRRIQVQVYRPGRVHHRFSKIRLNDAKTKHTHTHTQPRLARIYHHIGHVTPIDYPAAPVVWTPCDAVPARLFLISISSKQHADTL